MNSTNPQRIFRIGLSCLVLGCAGTTSVQAEYRCDDPQGVVDRRACDKAKEGPAALRLFIHRTRAIYGLYFYDYAPRDEAWWRADGVKPAQEDQPEIAKVVGRD